MKTRNHKEKTRERQITPFIPAIPTPSLDTVDGRSTPGIRIAIASLLSVFRSVVCGQLTPPVLPTTGNADNGTSWYDEHGVFDGSVTVIDGVPTAAYPSIGAAGGALVRWRACRA